MNPLKLKGIATGALLLFALAGCLGDGTGQDPVLVDLGVSLEFPSQQTPLNGLALGTTAEITGVSLSVDQGVTNIISGQALVKDGITGVWSTNLTGLPASTNLTFAAVATNASAVTIFTGSTTTVLSGAADQVSIPMNSVDDGVAPALPIIRKLIFPTAVAPSSTTGAISVELEGGNNETLTVAFTPGAGTFTQGAATTTLTGTKGTHTATFNAPVTESPTTHTVRVTNAQGNYVEQGFTIEVTSTGGNAITTQFAPVVTGLGGQRSGTTVIWTAVVEDDGLAADLRYEWGFNSTQIFTDNTTNPAVLLAYTQETNGLITLKVTDQQGAGASSTIAYYLPAGQFPDANVIDLVNAGNWLTVESGNFFSVAIRHNGVDFTQGTLWAWGDNPNGQLGQGDIIDRIIPTQIGVDSDWAMVAAGYTHVLAVKTDGSIWSWGNNGSGRLGLGDTTNRYRPTRITHNNLANPIIAISAGDSHSLAIDSINNMFSWGYNGYGQLGDGTTTGYSYPKEIGLGSTWIAIAASLYHSMAIAQLGVPGEGTLWTWGDYSNGRLGRGAIVLNEPSPVQEITGATNWTNIDSYGNSSFGLQSDGSLWATGYNYYGQLGLGDNLERNQFTRVGVPTDVWVTLAAGDNFTFGIKNDGSLWSWGYNPYGQLGVGDTLFRSTPTLVDDSRTWTAVSPGYYHSMALDDTDNLYSWGYNQDGQLGLGDFGSGTNRYVPTLVTQ